MIKTIWLWSIPQCQCLDEEFKESLLHSFIASRETAAYIPAWGEREAGWEKVWERFTHKWKSIPKPISYETIYVAALCTCRVVETDRKTGATVSWQLCFGFRAGLDSSARSHTLQHSWTLPLHVCHAYGQAAAKSRLMSILLTKWRLLDKRPVTPDCLAGCPRDTSKRPAAKWKHFPCQDIVFLRLVIQQSYFSISTAYKSHSPLITASQSKRSSDN